MSDWNSTQYLKFQKERTLPAIDLAKRIKNNPKTIVDIGCGPGNSTAVLRSVFPNSNIIGIDSSANMIKKATEQHPDLDFRLCDALSLKGKYDLIFSNACLQWIPNHTALIPALMNKLNNNGTLAIQIPMNSEEPLFQLIEEVSKDPKWNLSSLKLHPNETLNPTEYYNILSACSSDFDMWEVKYYHTMANHQALVDWVKSTRLKPYLDFLKEEKFAEFETEILEGLKNFYPVMDNGNIVLGFRRFFFTATK